MRYVAVALKTTGQDPKLHRISELAAVEVNDGTLGEGMHLQIAAAGAEGAGSGIAFHEAVARWKEFVGGSQINAHDYYEFKRFLRPECDRAGLGFAIAQDHPVADTWKLAKERFPKQRNSLEAVTRRLGIERNPAASDALETARLVAHVAIKLQGTRKAKSTAPPAVVAEPPSPPEIADVVEPTKPTPVPPSHRSFRERLTLCWQILVGHA